MDSSRDFQGFQNFQPTLLMWDGFSIRSSQANQLWLRKSLFTKAPPFSGLALHPYPGQEAFYNK